MLNTVQELEELSVTHETPLETVQSRNLTPKRASGEVSEVASMSSQELLMAEESPRKEKLKIKDDKNSKKPETPTFDNPKNP